MTPWSREPGVIVILVASLLGAGACVGKGDRQDALEPVEDSAQAVALARRVFIARHPSPDDTLRVAGYVRDGDDVLISLQPTEVILGGSGVVRVRPDGTAEIVSIQQ
jgi:hypothetical protein